MSMIGKTLGTFECTALLGKGGMGEVYKAKDQKLGRDVAIKVLPEEFAQDTDRVARFQREAKLLASLNHPNIAAIHGLEKSEGTHFLVLELIEGDTLADRLKRGAIPVEEALKLAIQIAEALEAAHEKGVIHRDLKPANIKVTPDEKVKVLDFGLAKAFAGEQAEANLSHSPTLSVAATQQGVILGTAAYMSPEQAKGKTVDKKTDIWAFGVLLFEILTGKPAFQGDEVSEILASVIRGDTNLDLLPPNIHPRIRELLTRCLQKDIRKRYADIAEARYEIEQVLADPAGVFAQPVATVKPESRFRLALPWVTLALALALIMTGIAVWILWPTLPEPPITRFSIDLAGRLESDSAIALSPDGRRFVYSANGQLYVQALDQMEPSPIPGTEKGLDPFFSPDGESVAFFTPTHLKKVSLTGMAPVVLSAIGEGAARGVVGAWDSQNRIFFGQYGPYGLSKIAASGGTPETFAELGDHGDLDFPDVLPGGDWVLFTDHVAGANWSASNIVAQSVTTGERKVLLRGGYFARYIRTGHLVYVQNGTLFAVGFNADRLEVIGTAVPIVQNVASNETTGFAQYVIASNGTFIYSSDTSSQNSIFLWMDREGNEEPLSVSPSDYSNPQISPDGTRVAFETTSGGNKDIWTWDFVRESMTRLTFDEANDSVSLWTPDGKRIAFFSGRGGVFGGVYWKPADGTGKAEQLISLPDQYVSPSSWSGDGNILLLESFAGSNNIGMLSMEGNHKMELLLQEKFNECQPRISPDGKWLAYMSDESGQFEIYVRPFPDVNKGRWKVSTSGGVEPKWSRDGRELFYRNGDAVMVVSVKTEPAFNLETPRVLFRGVLDYSAWITNTLWDVSPDGKRFLVIKESIGNAAKKVNSLPRVKVVLNWFAELKQRMAVD